MRSIEEARSKRTLVCFYNFDRASDPAMSGLSTIFHADAKEALFRVLKESPRRRGIDLCLYTRGGDVNSVWPIVSLLREFDKNFNVIVPFRCHSGGTLVALGAEKVVLGPLSELSPIDPTTANQFNPPNPAAPNTDKRLGISVEDVQAYREFVREQLHGKPSDNDDCRLDAEQMQPFLQKLIESVHPLALGNVYRVLQQITRLAGKLLELHPKSDRKPADIISALTSQFWSHLHMINRHEARRILGSRVEFASARLTNAMDALLREYEDSFQLRRTFYRSSFVGDNAEAPYRFVGGVLESRHWSYLFVTTGVIRQRTKLLPNVQIQLPAGQPLPLLPGLPRDYEVEIKSQGWEHNTDPKGVTV